MTASIVPNNERDVVTKKGELYYREYAKCMSEHELDVREWESLKHGERMSWECAANAVAVTVTDDQIYLNTLQARIANKPTMMDFKMLQKYVGVQVRRLTLMTNKFGYRVSYKVVPLSSEDESANG